MLALSVRQPWAWLIVQGYKDIENRAWSTRHRGPVLIHAGWNLAEDASPGAVIHGVQTPAEPDRGGIVGVVTITGCVTASDSPWFTGPYGFVLANARPLPFVPLRGRPGLFEVDDSLYDDTM